MPTTVELFVDKCGDIVKAKPVYTLGCSNTSKCDCIGMVKYGLRQNKVTLTTTGTNDTFRTKVDNIRQIKSVSDLKKGDVVFKCKKPGTSGYNLPAKYKKGGAGYNGDLTDYTHIGVVKGTNPLRIIHMTSPTAKTDSVIGNWKYAAELKPTYITYSNSVPVTPEVPTPEPEPVKEEQKAVVYSANGLPVKMRALPSVGCSLYETLPTGTMVIFVGTVNDTWSQISFGSRKGWYMMSKYLKFV